MTMLTGFGSQIAITIRKLAFSDQFSVTVEIDFETNFIDFLIKI